ncbi:hypothetical protein KC901_02725, partial [Patescibacteria group bacterium]|nr:hypothetical protein [Patescibacteria group bacterium]
MPIRGKVYIEKNNFLYSVEEYDFIYVFADAFMADEAGNIYLELDSIFYRSFKEIVMIYKDSLPAVIPISVIGDDLSVNSFVFHFN